MTFYVLVYWEWRNCWRLDCHSTLNNGHLFQMWQASVLRCVLSLLCTLYCTVSCVRYVRQLYTQVGLSPEPIHINYFAPVREGEVLWWPCLSVSLSLCVCPWGCLQLHVRSSFFTKIFVHVAYGRGSVLLCQCCDTLCISGFMDDVIFAHNGHMYCRGASENSRPAWWYSQPSPMAWAAMPEDCSWVSGRPLMFSQSLLERIVRMGMGIKTQNRTSHIN